MDVYFVLLTFEVRGAVDVGAADQHSTLLVVSADGRASAIDRARAVLQVAHAGSRLSVLAVAAVAAGPIVGSYVID